MVQYIVFFSWSLVEYSWDYTAQYTRLDVFGMLQKFVSKQTQLFGGIVLIQFWIHSKEGPCD